MDSAKLMANSITGASFCPAKVRGARILNGSSRGELECSSGKDICRIRVRIIIIEIAAPRQKKHAFFGAVKKPCWRWVESAGGY
jgi:hypothetical protein